MSSERSIEATAELLKGLVKIPSVSGNEAKAATFLEEDLLRSFPGSVKRLGHSVVVDIPGKRAGPTLLLCSHIDTVAASSGWTKDPYGAETEGDKIFGLGSNDAGASVVSMIGAAKAVGRPEAGRLILCFAAEEETGNQGFTKIEVELPRYDAAIFGEPTNMGMASSMRGAMRATMRSRGKACHASRPWEGQNATDQFSKDLALLRSIDLKDASPWRGATMEPTVIRGGESLNQIPDLVETQLDIRTTPSKDNDWICAELKKSKLDVEITINRRRPMHNDPASPLIKAIRTAHPDVVDYTFNGTCDMAFSTAPSVVMGPGRSERSHAADEFIQVSELKEAVRIYTSILGTYLA